ncbi:target of Myb protein 1 isoform X2 [Gadus macrocephalus]|uniref:target of Myb protein 1 isoform X2 n=1 Tax=Gadus macrocephalus TaxID=80720 RepID=UPI0028CBBC6E|nr:target of Myb protein 1 isoform X2 [Gadus macrocephalus]
MEFLIGNLFSTPIGTRIELATSSSLQSEDWALTMEICDLVNGSEEGPRDAVKAVRRRIVGNKNFKEVMYTLSVLEACVKNCGHRFHVLVSTREFIEAVLVRAIIPRNNPPLVLHDRVLSLIQAWADAFRSSPDLTGVVSVYEDLRRKGLDFPVVQLDGNSTSNPEARKSLPVNGALSIPPHRPPSQQDHRVFSPDQVKKLKADMGGVQSDLTIMADMMSQLDPVTAAHTDVERLQQLYLVCKAMQDRILEMVPRLSEEQLIEELLAVNDEMNTTFARYQRFERQMTNGESTTPKTPTYVNLTELGLASNSVDQSDVFNQFPVEAVSSQFVNLSTRESDSDADFPQTNSESHLRGSEPGGDAVQGVASAHAHCIQTHGMDPSRSLSPYSDWMVRRGMIPLNQSNMMDDVEKWLDYDDENADFDDSEGVTSAEFDRFLAGRAQAAERLPSLRTPSLDHSPPGTCSQDPPHLDPL